MDANLYPEPASVNAASCASCGAPLRFDAAICDSCGLPVPAGAAGLSAQPIPPAVPVTPPVESQETASTAATVITPTVGEPHMAYPPPPTGPMQRCNWCGAINAVGAERCVSCNATFPKPEQDDILIRASRERVRLAMEDFDEAERKRARGFLSRLFR